jgi:hypothetical protein
MILVRRLKRDGVSAALWMVSRYWPRFLRYLLARYVALHWRGPQILSATYNASFDRTVLCILQLMDSFLFRLITSIVIRRIVAVDATLAPSTVMRFRQHYNELIGHQIILERYQQVGLSQ